MNYLVQNNSKFFLSQTKKGVTVEPLLSETLGYQKSIFKVFLKNYYYILCVQNPF